MRPLHVDIDESHVTSDIVNTLSQGGWKTSLLVTAAWDERSRCLLAHMGSGQARTPPSRKLRTHSSNSSSAATQVAFDPIKPGDVLHLDIAKGSDEEAAAVSLGVLDTLPCLICFAAPKPSGQVLAWASQPLTSPQDLEDFLAKTNKSRPSWALRGLSCEFQTSVKTKSTSPPPKASGGVWGGVGA